MQLHIRVQRRIGASARSWLSLCRDRVSAHSSAFTAHISLAYCSMGFSCFGHDPCLRIMGSLWWIVRNPRGLAISSIRTQLNRDCTPLTSGPRQLAGLSALEAGRRRIDFGRCRLRGCHLLKMVVHGPNRKEWLARKVERANISGYGTIVRHRRCSTACTGISGGRSMRSARMTGELQSCAQYF